MDQFDVRTSGNVQLNMVRRGGDGDGTVVLAKMSRAPGMASLDLKRDFAWYFLALVFMVLFATHRRRHTRLVQDFMNHVGKTML